MILICSGNEGQKGRLGEIIRVEAIFNTDVGKGVMNNILNG